jgi:UDP-glucose 4-epimerase
MLPPGDPAPHSRYRFTVTQKKLTGIMSRTHVLITGVAGFIGSNLLDYLLDNTDWKITGIDNFSTGNRGNIAQREGDDRFELVEGNCGDLTTLKPYRYIFHLAALPRIQPSFQYVTEHIRENLVVPAALLELMIREDHYPRFVFSSSSAIYGTPKGIPTTEEEPVDCLSPYAFQKYEVEKYLELLSSRYPVNYVNLRYFNPYGPRSFNPQNKFNAYSSVVGIFKYRKENGLPLLVTGDGSQKRDFVHVYDLARANHMAAIHEGPLNTSFNIGFGDTLSVIDLAKMMSDRIEFIAKREGESAITFADISKARKVLGWEPKYRLEDFLNEKK